MNKIEEITNKQLNPNVPEFRVGDTVRVGVRIIEGKKERVQAFEGVVISRKGYGVSETFTVRKMSSGVGVERIFPIHSPKLDSIEVVMEIKGKKLIRLFMPYFLIGFKYEKGKKKKNSKRCLSICFSCNISSTCKNVYNNPCDCRWTIYGTYFI